MTNFPHSVKVEQPDRFDIIVIIDSYVLRPDFCMNISQNSIFSKKFQKIFKNIFQTYIQLLPTIGGPHFCNNIFFKIFYSPRRGRFVQNLKFLSYLTFLAPSETTFPKFSKLPQLKLPHTYPIFNILQRIKSKLDRKLWNFWFSGGRYYRFLRTKKFSWCIWRF